MPAFIFIYKTPTAQSLRDGCPKYEKPNSRYKGTAFCAYMQIYYKKKHPQSLRVAFESVTNKAKTSTNIPFSNHAAKVLLLFETCKKLTKKGDFVKSSLQNHKK